MLAQPVDVSSESVLARRPASEAPGGVSFGPVAPQSADRSSLQPLPAIRQSAGARPKAGSTRAFATTQKGNPPAAIGRPGADTRPRDRARLKLDPLDLSFERELGLKVTTALSASAEASPQRRAEAAALWQILSAEPDEMMRSLQRFQGLEADTKSLRDAVQANNASLGDLRVQLEQSQSQRYANGLIYALLALTLALALAGMAAVLAWRRGLFRLAPGPDWWRSGAAEDAADLKFDRVAATRVAAGDAAVTNAEPLDFELRLTESKVYSLQPKIAAFIPSAGLHAAGEEDEDAHYNSQPAGLRTMLAEELRDVQQQADFFVSLGEFPQAIDVLLAHINAHPDTSPLPWLDLLEIYFKLDRQQDYDGVRDEFQRVFNALVPTFGAYSADGPGLETYPGAMSRLVALWPSPKVLEFIEESMLRKPEQDTSEVFSLEAYRELLLLNNIGIEVIDGRAVPAGSESLSDWHASGLFRASLHTQPHSSSAAKPKRFDSEATHRELPWTDLDINLDEPPVLAVPSSEQGVEATSHLEPLDFHKSDALYRQVLLEKPRR